MHQDVLSAFRKGRMRTGKFARVTRMLAAQRKSSGALEKDALPTLKKPLESPSAASTDKTRDYTVRSQRKVRFFFAYTCLENIGMHVHIISIAAFNEHQLLIHMFILYYIKFLKDVADLLNPFLEKAVSAQWMPNVNHWMFNLSKAKTKH